MSFRVSITPTGQRSVDALRGKARKSFDAAVERLASEGCKAGDYRLSGEGIEHICSVQLYGRHRVLVCFPDDDGIVVLFVGEHLREHVGRHRTNVPSRRSRLPPRPLYSKDVLPA